MSKQASLPMIGWREWISLPHIGIVGIKAKIDTGARSSALHAFDIERFQAQGKSMIRFKVHPVQRDNINTLEAEAELLEERQIRSSGGHTQLRPVVRTLIAFPDLQGCWPIDLTLTNRSLMGFRMLLGRQAIRRRFVIDPGRSYLQSAASMHRYPGS